MNGLGKTDKAQNEINAIQGNDENFPVLNLVSLNRKMMWQLLTGVSWDWKTLSYIGAKVESSDSWWKSSNSQWDHRLLWILVQQHPLLCFCHPQPLNCWIHSLMPSLPERLPSGWLSESPEFNSTWQENNPSSLKIRGSDIQWHLGSNHDDDVT